MRIRGPRHLPRAMLVMLAAVVTIASCPAHAKKVGLNALTPPDPVVAERNNACASLLRTTQSADWGSGLSEREFNAWLEHCAKAERAFCEAVRNAAHCVVYQDGRFIDQNGCTISKDREGHQHDYDFNSLKCIGPEHPE